MAVRRASGPAPVGVISDTHGLVRDEALEALRGCERIVHAGDIGGPQVLERLARIAPVEAVRGNNDREPWARDVPAERVVEIGDTTAYLTHEPAHVPEDVAERGHGIVIVGHTHRPLIEQRERWLHVNPGSAGPRRFTLPVTLALLWPREDGVHAELIEIVPPVRR